MESLRRDELVRALPYARRYARALAGSQQVGDRLVAESLSDLLAGGASPPGRGITAHGDARQALYAAVTRRFDRRPTDDARSSAALSLKQRQLLLLTHLEELSVEDAAAVVALELDAAAEQLKTAREHLHDSAATDVLIIEDEPIIAMDIEDLVRNCGHRVVGVAATEADAVRIADMTKLGLILADINLGAGGDGTNAVARILHRYSVPVIFVTAYPERLLTGEAVEPAFVIAKPFDPMTLAIATYQAVTGGVRLD
jgi:CheY-like chemotaxis protein